VWKAKEVTIANLFCREPLELFPSGEQCQVCVGGAEFAKPGEQFGTLFAPEAWRAI